MDRSGKINIFFYSLLFIEQLVVYYYDSLIIQKYDIRDKYGDLLI